MHIVDQLDFSLLYGTEGKLEPFVTVNFCAISI